MVSSHYELSQRVIDFLDLPASTITTINITYYCYYYCYFYYY